MTSIEPRLRYLDANHVDTPAGRLDGAVLVSPAQARLGTLEGVLVDPQRRQVRYYVVARKRGLFSSHHYLLPLTATRLDRDRHTLEVDVEADEIPQLAEVSLEANNRTWDAVIEQDDALGVFTEARPPFGCLGLTLRREA